MPNAEFALPINSAVFLFAVCSVVGWLAETVYRSTTAGRFVNPGLLRGPYLPIYGVSAVCVYAIWERLLHFDCSLAARAFAYAGAITAIELTTGLVFVRSLRIRLWDYSDVKLNFMGIIAPQFALIWVAMSVASDVYLFGALPVTAGWFERATTFAVTGAISCEFAIRLGSLFKLHGVGLRNLYGA
jgi:uncharacterized protein